MAPVFAVTVDPLYARSRVMTWISQIMRVDATKGGFGQSVCPRSGSVSLQRVKMDTTATLPSAQCQWSHRATRVVFVQRFYSADLRHREHTIAPSFCSSGNNRIADG